MAAAEIFRLIVDNVLMETPPASSHHKKTVPLPKGLPGAFGVPVAAYGCKEEQALGSLHVHIVFWGGLQPTILQAAGEFTYSLIWFRKRLISLYVLGSIS